MQGEDFALVMYFCFHRRDELCIPSYPSYKKSKSSLSRKLNSFFFFFSAREICNTRQRNHGLQGNSEWFFSLQWNSLIAQMHSWCCFRGIFHQWLWAQAQVVLYPKIDTNHPLIGSDRGHEMNWWSYGTLTKMLGYFLCFTYCVPCAHVKAI